MRRLLRPLALLALLVLPALPAYAQSARSAHVMQVDPSRYPEVTLYVSVTDQAGETVGGLLQNDFAITEDGQPVTITGFAGAGASPVNTVLVLDRSGSMGSASKMEGALDAARAFIRQMRPGDQTALIAFSDQPELVQPFTGDTQRLEDVLRRIRPDGATALYDSLISGVETLSGMPGRRALLLLTDGRDIRAVQDPQPASAASLDQAIETAVKAGIAVQVVGLGDRGTSSLTAGIDEGVLRRIADESGGQYFYTPEAAELAALYSKLSANLQREYALTYQSPRPFYDGTRRDIRVDVKGAEVASGAYVEQHLIDVRSNPLVGLGLLLPILAALLMPMLARRMGSGRQPAAPLALEVPSAARAALPERPPAITVVRPGLPRCQGCDAPLVPPDARFCIACGTAQQSAPVRTFCVGCGRPLRAGAHFCGHCGTPVQQPVSSLEERV